MCTCSIEIFYYKRKQGNALLSTIIMQYNIDGSLPRISPDLVEALKVRVWAIWFFLPESGKYNLVSAYETICNQIDVICDDDTINEKQKFVELAKLTSRKVLFAALTDWNTLRRQQQ